MANWQYELDIQDAWKKAKEDEISCIDLSKEIVTKLEVLKPALIKRFTKDSQVVILLNAILRCFKKFIAGKDDNKDEFDAIFNQLYDWADMSLDTNWPTKKLCWVNIFS